MIAEIKRELEKRLPETYDILIHSGLTVHPSICKVVLIGSRGLRNNYRRDSDIDLSLLVAEKAMKSGEDHEGLFKDILDTTLSNWQGSVELDTAVVFDICNCGLRCFHVETSNERPRKEKGIDCMGLYKLQKGFTGYVPKIGIDIERIYPMITVYEQGNILS